MLIVKGRLFIEGIKPVPESELGGWVEDSAIDKEAAYIKRVEGKPSVGGDRIKEVPEFKILHHMLKHEVAYVDGGGGRRGITGAVDLLVEVKGLLT